MNLFATVARIDDWDKTTEDWDEYVSKLPRNCQIVGFTDKMAIILINGRLRLAYLSELYNVEPPR